MASAPPQSIVDRVTALPDATRLAPGRAPVTEPPAVDDEVADCFMYLEMYPELLEIDPGLSALCETDVAAARSIISDLLNQLSG